LCYNFLKNYFISKELCNLNNNCYTTTYKISDTLPINIVYTDRIVVVSAKNII